jgi:hypothetical protein
MRGCGWVLGSSLRSAGLTSIAAASTGALAAHQTATEEVIRQYRDFMNSAPRRSTAPAIYLTGPPEDFVPAHLVGPTGSTGRCHLRRTGVGRA